MSDILMLGLASQLCRCTGVESGSLREPSSAARPGASREERQGEDCRFGVHEGRKYKREERRARQHLFLTFYALGFHIYSWSPPIIIITIFTFLETNVFPLVETPSSS